MDHRRARIALAEAFGTAVLVVGGPGTAIFLTLFGNPPLWAVVLTVALAFGLSLMVMAYTIGNISGCHINPAVTLGMWASGKVKGADVPVFIGAQFVGGLIGSSILWLILKGTSGYYQIAKAHGFASNGWGNQSPSHFGFTSVATIEVVVTLIFVIAVVSTSRKSMAVGMTGVTVGFALTLAHLIAIPVDNTSVNPARSFATAVYAPSAYLEQVWAFFVFPAIGGILAGLLWRVMVHPEDL